jgi:carotenoid 1,2-hydratase
MAVSVIAFVGSVFSPYYHWSGRSDPLNHCAINVAVYGREGNRWAMTERAKRHVWRERNTFQVGPSSISWDGIALTARINELGCPIPRRIRGTIKLYPALLFDRCVILDGVGGHRWGPIAPHARIEVALDEPSVAWQGTGYFDTNDGDEPLETGFRRWDWARADVGDGTAILYDVVTASGEARDVALHIGRDGDVQLLDPPQRLNLPRTAIWRLPRSLRVDTGAKACVTKTLEDTPFYGRSVVNTRLNGHDVTAIHESLSLARLRQPIVRAMLPFRMPRRR